MRIRILVADDQTAVRLGLQFLFSSHPRFEIVGEAFDGNDALAKAIETKPDIIILEHFLRYQNGLALTRQIRAQLPKTEILVYTNNANSLGDFLKVGARGFVLKSDSGQILIAAIENLAAHLPYFTSRVSETLLESYLTRPRDEISILTTREREVVMLVANGHTSKEIARQLKIGLKTVESHRAAVMRKMDFSTSADMVRYAVRNKLVEP